MSVISDEPDLGAYHGWLYHTAAGLLGNPCHPDIDDLVQEGRIAMWKALAAYDDCKGTLAPWLANAARMRMRDLAYGHSRWTGSAGRRGWTDAMGRKAPRPLPLGPLLDDPEFDQRRLRQPVAASKVMTAANVRAWRSA